MLTILTVDPALRTPPEKRPYTLLRIVRLVPNVFTYMFVCNQARGMRQSPIPYKSGQA